MNASFHGTLGGYQYHNCRCRRCKDAVNTYLRNYRRRKANEAWLASISPERRARILARQELTPEQREEISRARIEERNQRAERIRRELGLDEGPS